MGSLLLQLHLAVPPGEQTRLFLDSGETYGEHAQFFFSPPVRNEESYWILNGQTGKKRRGKILARSGYARF